MQALPIVLPTMSLGGISKGKKEGVLFLVAAAVSFFLFDILIFGINENRIYQTIWRLDHLAQIRIGIFCI